MSTQKSWHRYTASAAPDVRQPEVYWWWASWFCLQTCEAYRTDRGVSLSCLFQLIAFKQTKHQNIHLLPTEVTPIFKPWPCTEGNLLPDSYWSHHFYQNRDLHAKMWLDFPKSPYWPASHTLIFRKKNLKCMQIIFMFWLYEFVNMLQI